MPRIEAQAVEPCPVQGSLNFAPLRARVSFSDSARILKPVFGSEAAPLGLQHYFQIQDAGYIGCLAAISTGTNGFVV